MTETGVQGITYPALDAGRTIDPTYLKFLKRWLPSKPLTRWKDGWSICD